MKNITLPNGIIQCGVERLSTKSQHVVDFFWYKLIELGINKEKPMVVYQENLNGGICADHCIFIDETGPFPYGREFQDVLLEELLHWICRSNDSETSADFSEKWHNCILHFIHLMLKNKDEETKRKFQNILITEFRKLLN